jgi:hypothetical protein
MKIDDLFMEEFKDWILEEQIEKYGGNTIFLYMNGAGEIYQMYNYRELAVGTYKKAEHEEITVEIFDMGSSEDAYGVFTHSFTGNKTDVGQGAFARSGIICFWKSKFYVCITSREHSKTIQETIIGMAKRIADDIKETGTIPELISCLPEKGLKQDSIKYFHDRNALNYHYFLSTENILNLNPETNAVLAEYKVDNGKYYLLMIEYPDRKTAMTAKQQFLDSYIPEGKDTGMHKLEDGKWTAVNDNVKYLIIALETPSRESARKIIDKTVKKLEVIKHE